MNGIYITLAIEDELSEAVLRKILTYSDRSYIVKQCLSQTGYGYLKSRIGAFNNAARHFPFLVLTDLDRDECAPVKIQAWLKGKSKHHNLLFRVAVREVESWLLADHENFALFLNISKTLVPSNPDELMNPKQTLINLARKSRKRDTRNDILPRPKSTATQGPAYNLRLRKFIRESWEIGSAMINSPSLKRTVRVIQGFQPI